MTTIMSPAPSKPTPKPESPTNFIGTPRPKAIEIIKRTMEYGQPVTFDQTTLRFLKKGQKFEESDQLYQALETGCFIKMSVWEHHQPLDGPPSSFRWGYYCPHLDEAIEQCFDQMTPIHQESLVVHCVFHNIMRQDRDARTARRHTLTAL